MLVLYGLNTRSIGGTLVVWAGQFVEGDHQRAFFRTVMVFLN